MPQHLIKLSVGSTSLEDLAAWFASPPSWDAQGRPCHITRMWPKNAARVLDGGSIYWVIKGQVLARQRILALDPADLGDGIARCAIVLDRQIVRVRPVPRRPFQGWRYLAPQDAPPDLGPLRPGDDALPAGLAAALDAMGVL